MIKLPKKPSKDKDLALAEDYYAGEPPQGVWGGKGAALLGLTAQAVNEAMEPRADARTPTRKNRSGSKKVDTVWIEFKHSIRSNGPPQPPEK
jgi:hypothetical protein